jgi:hypothetical protein
MEFPMQGCAGTIMLSACRPKLSVRLISFLIIIVLNSLFSKSYAQLAPVNPPTGGFRIDGGLKANTPVVGEGDWVVGPAGAGGFVLSNAGIPTNAATTGWKTDAYNSAQDFIFTSGSKFNDIISALQWTQSSAPDKNDINNAMFHVSVNTSTQDQWIVIGGDRLSTNGTSYIDCEFLQNTLTRNSSGGGFTGAGPHGGRTENDLVISMEYTNGGVSANVFFYQWKPKAGGGYQWQQFTPPAGTAFALTNGANEDVPFGAFGNNIYQPFAFVEAAINVTRLLQATGNACASLSVKTLWIKTKAAATGTAALKDFVEPIPVSFTFGTASIDYSDPFCAVGTASVTQTGTTGGTYSGSPAGLSINASTGEINLAASAPDTYTVTYSFNSGNNCTKTATTSVVINPFPACSITGPEGPLCPGATGNTYTGPGGTDLTYSWSVTGNGSIPGSATGQSVNVTAGSNCTSGTFTLSLTVTGAGGCQATCTKTVNVVNVTAPVITCPADKQLQCSESTDPTNTGTATATGNCSSNITITYTDAPTAAGCTGVPGIARTWKAVDGCGNESTCVQQITFIDNTAPVISCATDLKLECGSNTDPTVGNSPTATDNCGTPTLSHNDVPISLNCIAYIKRTWTATDGCGNSSTCVQNITFVDNNAPVITCPQNTEVVCGGSILPANTGTATATDCSAHTIFYTDAPGANSACGIPNINRKWTALDASGNISTCVQQITFVQPAQTLANTAVSNTAQKSSPLQPISQVSSDIKVIAYPNPYSTNVSFQFVSPISGKAVLEVYDMVGRKLAVVFQGYVQAGSQRTVNYRIPFSQRTPIIYKLRIGDRSGKGKLLPGNHKSN